MKVNIPYGIETMVEIWKTSAALNIELELRLMKWPKHGQHDMQWRRHDRLQKNTPLQLWWTTGSQCFNASCLVWVHYEYPIQESKNLLENNLFSLFPIMGDSPNASTIKDFRGALWWWWIFWWVFFLGLLQHLISGFLGPAPSPCTVPALRCCLQEAGRQWDGKNGRMLSSLGKKLVERFAKWFLFGTG